MKQVKILLIEDNPVDRLVTEKMLVESNASKDSPLGMQVDTAETLADGLQKAQEGPIDLILLDLGLPDSWGIDTFNRVHKKAGGVPIIILTSLNDEGMAFVSVENGAKKYLVKGTVDDQELMSSVEEICGAA